MGYGQSGIIWFRIKMYFNEYDSGFSNSHYLLIQIEFFIAGSSPEARRKLAGSSPEAKNKAIELQIK